LQVRAAWVAKTAGQMLWPVAREAGYFSKYGLDVDLQFIATSTVAVPALMAGDVGLAAMAGSAVVSAQAGGSDIVMFAGLQNQPIFRVVAGPSIATLADLKGQTIAVTQIGSNDYFIWQTIARRQGWAPDDVKLVAATGVDGQIALLQKGDVQAIAVSPPNNVVAIKQAGGHEVLNTSTLDEPEQNLGITAVRSYLAANRGLCLAMLKATIEATRRYKEDPAFAKQVIRTYLDVSDPEIVDAGYEAYVPIFPREPYPTRPGFGRIMEEIATQNPRASSLNPDQLMDASLVDELKNSGFVQQVYS
jgi:NitT/TauT family transport system substrate-binding protein